MIKDILIYPKDKKILTQESEEVKNVEEVQDLIQNMKDTLHSTKQGVGISAVQIGVLKRVCLVHHNNKDIVLINPVITRYRGTQKSLEGCLSVPEKYGTFERPQKIWVEYLDETGKQCELSEGGFLTRIICHELDHLEGKCPVFGIAEENNND